MSLLGGEHRRVTAPHGSHHRVPWHRSRLVKQRIDARCGWCGRCRRLAGTEIDTSKARFVHASSRRWLAAVAESRWCSGSRSSSSSSSRMMKHVCA